MYLIPHRLYHKVGRVFIYELEEHFDCGIYLCFIYLSRYEIIILEYHLLIRNKLLVSQN